MFGILKELFAFLIEKKKIWLFPLLLLLLLIGGLLIISQGSTLSPFIYTIF